MEAQPFHLPHDRELGFPRRRPLGVGFICVSPELRRGLSAFPSTCGRQTQSSVCVAAAVGKWRPCHLIPRQATRCGSKQASEALPSQTQRPLCGETRFPGHPAPGPSGRPAPEGLEDPAARVLMEMPIKTSEHPARGPSALPWGRKRGLRAAGELGGKRPLQKKGAGQRPAGQKVTDSVRGMEATAGGQGRKPPSGPGLGSPNRPGRKVQGDLQGNGGQQLLVLRGPGEEPASGSNPRPWGCKLNSEALGDPTVLSDRGGRHACMWEARCMHLNPQALDIPVLCVHGYVLCTWTWTFVCV